MLGYIGTVKKYLKTGWTQEATHFPHICFKDRQNFIWELDCDKWYIGGSFKNES